MTMNGKVAIVTGAASGIGKEIAREFVAAGAKVAIADLKADAADATARELDPTGATAMAVAMDVTDEDQVNAGVDAVAARFGGIDVLVNNAANALAQPVGEYTSEAWQKSLDVNLRGPVFLIQAALPYLKESNYAAVLNVVSPAAFMFSSFVSIYGIGKAGLLSATRSAAAELAPFGIRVNALAPGTVNTDMVRANGPEMQEAMTKVMLLQRMAEPDEMFGPALLLTSDAGSFITGQVLLADGGMVPH